MIKFTLLDLVAIVGYEALKAAGGPLIVAALIFLAVPSLRRRALWRRIAYGLLALTGGLVLCAAPILSEVWQEHERAVAFAAATHHLTKPERFGNATFPAGSTVHLGEHGQVEFGTLPVPTVVGGLSLVGDFRLDPADGADPPGIADATLAATAEIHGIPCGPGALISQPETTRCVLARDYVFAGHVLAQATQLEVYRSPLHEPPMLNFGVLGRPERLVGVVWPAGTIVGRIDQTPDRMADDPGPGHHIVTFCLPSGRTAALTGATLHGFISYDVVGDERHVSPVCSILPETVVGDDGYAEVGVARYTRGDRPAAGAWQWHD